MAALAQRFEPQDFGCEVLFMCIILPSTYTAQQDSSTQAYGHKTGRTASLDVSTFHSQFMGYVLQVTSEARNPLCWPSYSSSRTLVAGARNIFHP
jgi:hypothetical protein